MLTQLTTLLGLTPSTAQTEAKLPEGGDADFAEVFARIEANDDPRPEADQEVGELVADVDEATEDNTDLDEPTDRTQEPLDAVEPVELSKHKLESQEEPEDFSFLEQDKADVQTPEIVSADAPEVTEKPLQDSQVNAALASIPERRVARAQLRFDNDRNFTFSEPQSSQPVTRGIDSRFPTGKSLQPKVDIRESSLPTRVPEKVSPELPSSWQSAIQEPTEMETTLGTTIPLRPVSSSDTTVNRLESSVFGQATPVLFDKTEVPKATEATRSTNLDTSYLAVNPSIKTHDNVQTPSPAREVEPIDFVPASRSALGANNDSDALRAGDFGEPIQLDKKTTSQEVVSNITTRIPKPSMAPLDDQPQEMPTKPPHLFEQEHRPVLTPIKETHLSLPSSSRGDAHLAEQTRGVLNIENPKISTEKGPSEPLELSPGTDRVDPKPREVMVPQSDSTVKISAISVEKAAEMPVFARQFQPRPEPTATLKTSDLGASRIDHEVKLDAAVPSHQDSDVRIPASESIELTKVSPKPENWSDRPLREPHFSEQPVAIKAKPTEPVFADPQNKITPPAASVQASRVNYPFLAVSDDEIGILEAALQAPSGELRTQHSTPVMPGQNSPIRPDPALVMRQVSEGIQKLSEAGGVELRLSPEELGSVRMQFIQGDSGLTVHINAERPETLDLIRRHIDQLAKDLAESGFDSAGFSFGDENTKGQHKASSANLDAKAEESVSTEHLVAQGLDGLDIRV